MWLCLQLTCQDIGVFLAGVQYVAHKKVDFAFKLVLLSCARILLLLHICTFVCQTS